MLRDADLDRAAEGAVRASFSNAGQLCVSTERMFVADQVYDRFVDRFVARVKAMRMQPGLAWGSRHGLADQPAQLDATIAHVEDARSKGVTGARRRPGAARPRPLLLRAHRARGRHAGHGSASATRPSGRSSRSTGSPTRPTRSPAPTTGEYGLNASIYSQDGARGRAVARQIRCGTVNVNEAFAATFASIDAPMGGMRESGLGRRQGGEGVLRYTETQSVATQRLLRFGPMLGLSDERTPQVMTAQTAKLLKKLVAAQ